MLGTLLPSKGMIQWLRWEEGEMGHSIQRVPYVITLYFTNAYSIFSTLIPQRRMKD